MHTPWKVCVLLFFTTVLAAEPFVSRAEARPVQSSYEQAQSAFARGAFEEAISGWLEAAELYALDGRSEDQARTLVRLAGAYQNLGLSGDALRALGTARLLNQDASNRVQVEILATLGSVYLSLRAYPPASEMLTAALDLATELDDDPLTAFIENNRGGLLGAEGFYDAAIQSYLRSARLARNESLEALHGRALSNAATLSCKTEDYESCLRLGNEGMDVVRALGLSYDKAQLSVNFGENYAILARALPDRHGPLRLAAYEALSQGAEVAETIGDLRTRSYAYGGIGSLYEDEGRFEEALVWTRRALAAVGGINSPESLYRWQWQSGRLLRALEIRDDAIESYRASIQTLQTIRQEAPQAYTATATSFRESAGRAYFEMIDLLLERVSTVSDIETTSLNLNEARDTVELFKLAELRDYFRDDCVDTYLARETSLDALSAEAAIIYPIILPDRLELLVGISGRLSRTTVPVREDALMNLVRIFRLLLEGQAGNAYLAPAAQLYEWVMRPLEPLLTASGVDTIVFVPDGALRTIPMAALYDGEAFLIESYAVAVTPSLRLSDPRPLARDNISVLTLGLTEAVQNFAALPGAGEETDAIRELFPGTALIDEDFVVANVESALADREFSIVHIASHAAFAANPEDSFLLTYDNRFTLDDLGDLIGRLRLRENPIELLTLSACESAAGDDRAALGLAGVAVKAGAKSALATLWQISDAASSELITSFYEELQNSSLSKAKALRQAQLQLLAEEQYEHPFFWSPFILINNWL